MGRSRHCSEEQPRMIKDSLELPVSTVTVRRRLYEANLLTRIPHKVPLFKKKKKRHVQKKNILWTDESKIVLFGIICITCFL
uniref:Transposase Tc1-like domain-containing protein n=1 Tax=Echeneis naucrates TaxID=173247 RepID=A0A665WZI0_ECHNA